ncbi:capsular polysaccharide biosynthesis protein [Microvirga lupini]|uniref:Capsular polysaccharide biosynthesis protein n=1 Tax=Microvirga lupini TaxID=420324 RepID=A0A7W4VRJ0_9HYPH|nr:capsular polysaccharide biosynthesis protein [Microvirga lupini]
MTSGGRSSYRPRPTQVAEPHAFTRDQAKQTLRQVARFFRRQKAFITITTLAIALTTAAMSYALAPVYTATAAIVVERSRDPLLRDERERPVAAIELANDLRDIIRSRPVIEAVVDKLRPHERPRRQSNVMTAVFETLDDLGLFSLPPLRERYIRRWTKSLLVEADGDYVTISLEDEDPEIAAAVLSSVVEAQQRRYVDVLRASHGSQLRRVMLSRVQADMAALRGTLASLSAPTANSSGYTVALAQLSAIRSMISDSEDQFSSFRIRLGPDHPETIAAKHTSDTLRENLSALAQDVQTLERTAIRSEEMQLLIRFFAEAVDAARKNLDKSELHERSDTRTVSLRIAEQALPPIAPDVSRILQLAIGFAAGLIFAVGAAIIRDRLSSSLTSIEDVENILQSPVRVALGSNRNLARSFRSYN